MAIFFLLFDHIFFIVNVRV